MQLEQQASNQDFFCTLGMGYKADPVFYVEHGLNHFTWSKQREILRSVRDNEKTAVRACHGSSKTFTSAEIAVWFLNCFDDSKVITTAPTHTQIKKLLWAEINKIYTTSRVKLLGECLTTEIKTEQPDCYAIGFSTDKPARAEGWHAPSILFIFDEAKGLPQWLWDSVKGLMTGGFCRWLAISTTDGVEVGENFYNIFSTDGNGWNKIHISADESPYVTGEKFQYLHFPNENYPERFEKRYKDPKEVAIQIASPKWMKEREDDWGKDSVLYLTKVKGEIADQGADTIIKLSQVVKMFANWSDPDFDDEGAEECGVDVARGGADDTVFIRRKGMRVTGIRVIPSKELPPKAKEVYLANELEDFVDHDKEMSIKPDDTGIGGAITDIMESRDYNVIPINFGEKANEPDKYPNTISEMWFEVARVVNEIACPETVETERLKKELVNRKHKNLDKKGRRVVESKDDYKKRGFGSPDLADAFLLCFYNPYSEDAGELMVL